MCARLWFACQCKKNRCLDTSAPCSRLTASVPPSVCFCQYEDDAVRQLLVAAGAGSQGGSNVSAWIGLTIGTTTGAAIPGSWTDGEGIKTKGSSSDLWDPRDRR